MRHKQPSVSQMGHYAKLLILILLLSGCSMLRKVDRDKTETTGKEEIITKTTRKGDTVTYIVPKIRYKDTTIITYNRVGTRLETRYDDRGNIDLARCIESAVEELKIENRVFMQNVDKKLTEKEIDANINWTWIVIAGMLVVGALVYKKV